MSDVRTVIVKVTIPQIIVDRPKVTFRSKDGSFEERVDLSPGILQFLAGKTVGYFELKLSKNEIISMKPVPELTYDISVSATDKKEEVLQ